jgi:Family of unknown function (DUF5362)
MDQDQSSLFGMGIDPTSKLHLAEAARWARFLAIIGFVMCALLIVLGIFAGSIFSIFTNRYSSGYSSGSDMTNTFGAVFIVLYAIIAVIYFFPCLFLFRFASLMKSALASNDQDMLNGSFQNLKKLFRYVGILTIIALAFYLIAFLIAIATASSMR